MTITHYATEDKDGNQVTYYGEGIAAYESARDEAEHDRLRVIEIEFEFSDSAMIEDYTQEPVEDEDEETEV